MLCEAVKNQNITIVLEEEGFAHKANFLPEEQFIAM